MFSRDAVAMDLKKRCLQLLLRMEDSLAMLIRRLEAGLEGRTAATRCPTRYLECSDSQFLRVRSSYSKIRNIYTE